jgi:hypothetical protein
MSVLFRFIKAKEMIVSNHTTHHISAAYEIKDAVITHTRNDSKWVKTSFWEVVRVEMDAWVRSFDTPSAAAGDPVIEMEVWAYPLKEDLTRDDRVIFPLFIGTTDTEISAEIKAHFIADHRLVVAN